jgi:hypothetical protein
VLRVKVCPRTALFVGAAALAACHPVRARKASSVTLAVLPAESDRFPIAAKAVTDSLAQASVADVDRTELSKVSLEVVQLSIECVEPTADCYAEVGKSLAADKLLFAQVAGDKKHVTVTVTYFDVDTRAPTVARKVFGSEEEAARGVAALVAEATR